MWACAGGREDTNANLAAHHRDFVVRHRVDVLDDDSEPLQLSVELVAEHAAELWERTAAVAFVDGIAPVDEGANLGSNRHGPSCEMRSGTATTIRPFVSSSIGSGSVSSPRKSRSPSPRKAMNCQPPAPDSTSLPA